MHRARHPYWFAAVVLGMLAGSTLPVLAQDTPATPQTGQKPEALAIAPAYIPDQADQDERFAEQVAEHSAPLDPQGIRARQLAEIHDGIVTLAGTYSRQQLGELTAPRLNSLDKYWRLYDRRLGRWQARIQEFTARHSADAGELAKRRAAWEATLQSSTAEAIAPALLERINDIIGRLQSAQSAISAPLNEAISLGRRGNQVRADLDRGRRTLNDAIATYTRRLYMIDMPPLWQIQSTGPETADQFAADTNVGVRVEVSFIRDYVSDRSRELLAFGIAWLAALPLFFWFAWREQHREPASDAGPSPDRILHRPISGWLLLGALAFPLMFADAPVGMQQAMLLAGVIPVIRLLPDNVFKLLRWLPYAIVALYFLHRMRVVLWDDPLYYRIHLLLIALLTAAITLWLLIFTAHRPTVLQGRRRTVLRALGWMSVAALGAAAIANVVGNVSLAEMLTVGVIESAYVGLAIYAGMSALLSIGRILLADPAADQGGFVARNISPLRSGLRRLVQVGALVFWMVVAIDEFQIYRPTAEWLTALLTKKIPVGELEFTLGGVLLFLLSVWVALWIAKTTRVLLQNEVLSNMRLPAGVANSVASLTYYALVFVGFLLALAAAGFELSQLTLVIGALGVGIGLGLQNVVANFVSGLILMFERPIRPGDVVEIAGTSGRVREIGMRATTLQTFEGADVIVPNGNLLSGNLINWTLNNTNRRIDLDVGVSYSADPPAVQLLLAQVARTIPGISALPEPAVIFLRFNSSSLDFGVRAWTSDFDSWRSIQSALGVAVHRALKEAGIEIPFPQQDLHLRSIDVEARVRLAKLSQEVSTAAKPDSSSPPASS